MPTEHDLPPEDFDADASGNMPPVETVVDELHRHGPEEAAYAALPDDGARIVTISNAPDAPADDDASLAPVAGAAVVTAARRPASATDVLMPVDVEALVEGMRAYQRMLPRLLEPTDWQSADGNGRPLPHPFLKRSGYRKIARAFNLSFEIVHQLVERDTAGRALRAETFVRAIAPNGQYGDGDGYCDSEESRFQRAAGRAKLENDLRATATTRAKNRAVADLVGMGEVSAEEIATGAPAAAAPASPQLAALVDKALGYLFDGDLELVERCKTRLAEQYGAELLPSIAGQAIVIVAQEVHRLHEALNSQPEGPQ